MSGKATTLAPQIRSFEFDHSSIDEEARTVDIIFSTETEDVVRDYGVEILSHSPGAVDMSRLENGAAVLMYHDRKDQVGVVDAAKIEPSVREGHATLRFSRSKRADDVFTDIKDRIRTKFSVGYQITDAVHEGQRSDGLDVYRMSWKPFEISVESIPADDGAGIRSDSVFGKRAAELSTQVVMSKSAENTQERAADQDSNAPETPEAKAPEVEARTATIDHPAEVKREVTAEVERRDEIRALGSEFGIDDVKIKEAIRSEVTIEDFRSEVVLPALQEKHKAFSQARTDEAPSELEKGTRAYTMTKWSESAKRALGNRGNSIEVPDYGKQPQIERNYIGGDTATFHRSMAGSVTLADVAKLDVGIGSPVIDETSTHAPEVAIFPVDVISGATVELSVLKSLPTVGFRNANEGTTSKKGEFESKIFQTQVIEEPIQVDIQGVLNASRDPGRVLVNESVAVSKAVMEHIGKQTWYAGTAQSISDAKAAPGLIAQAETATSHVVDAGGSSDRSSVWLVQLGEDSLAHVYGNDTTLNFGEDWMEETVEDASGGKLRALVNFISGRVAVKLANKNSAIRIKNLDASANALDDATMFSALQRADELGMTPNAIFMAPRSQYQLQSGRTATTPSGSPAPLPSDFEGIPIYTTRNILTAETV